MRPTVSLSSESPCDDAGVFSPCHHPANPQYEESTIKNDNKMIDLILDWKDRNHRLYAAFVLTIISCLYFLDNISRYLVSVSPIPYIDYHSYEYALLAGPLFALCYTGGGIIIAVVSDVFATDQTNLSLQMTQLRKNLTIICAGTCLFSLAFYMSSVATSFWQQALIRMAMGLAQSIITPFSCGIIKQIFPITVQGLAFGIFNVGVYVAFSLALSLGTYLYDRFGWRAAYQIFGFLGIALGLVSAILFNYITLNPHHDVITISDSSINTSQHSLISRLSTHNDDRLSADDFVKESSNRDQTANNLFSHSINILSDVIRQWRQRPVIFVVTIATGIRLGAGYVWSSYTSVFFNELFVIDDDQTSCYYSYSESSSGAIDMCSSSYPYCRDRSCYSLNRYPWHNVGVSHTLLEEYMGWVPLLGKTIILEFLDMTSISLNHCVNRICSGHSLRRISGRSILVPVESFLDSTVFQRDRMLSSHTSSHIELVSRCSRLFLDFDRQRIRRRGLSGAVLGCRVGVVVDQSRHIR